MFSSYHRIIGHKYSSYHSSPQASWECSPHSIDLGLIMLPALVIEVCGNMIYAMS